MARNFGKPALLGAAFCLSACGNAQGDSELLNQTRQFAIEVSQTWSTPKFSSASAIAALKTRSLSISSVAVSDTCKSVKDKIASSASRLAEIFEDSLEGTTAARIFGYQYEIAAFLESPEATACQEGFGAVATDLRRSAKL